MHNFKIINFSNAGGIKQFSDYFIKNCFESNIEVLNTNKLSLLYQFISKYKNDSIFIFTNNNLKIYYLFIFFKFKSILILHDHKTRNNASFREKLLHFFIYKNINKFEKVIIHENNTELLTRYNNFQYLKMPYHNGEITDNYNKINLLFFGRLEAYKNIELLVNAFSSQIIQKKYNLIIAGKGNISKSLIDTINKNSNVTLLNQFIDDRTRDIFINWSHYFILPYNSLTQTGIIDMAGYYKKPSLISNISEFEEYRSQTFKNTIDITNIDSMIHSLSDIYDTHSSFYSNAVDEAYNRYLISSDKWKDYKSEIESTLCKK
jgi:glycosyltransferase involved in cell wall biosynthesis